MRTRRRKPGRGSLLAMTMVALAWAGAERGAAQDPPRPPAPPGAADCRCVDAAGDPIEDCTCFRFPRGRLEVATGPMGWVSPRARIGVTIDPEQGADTDALGARVRDVLDDGPADRAGLQAGDVIVRIDGSSVLSPLPDAARERRLDLDRSVPVQRLQALAGALEPHEEVEVEYLRDGERRTASLVPDEARGFTAFGIGPDGPDVRIAPRFRMGDGPWTFRDRDAFHRDALRERFDDAGGRMRIGGDGLRSGGLVWLDREVAGLELAAMTPGLSSYFGTDRGVLVLSAPETSPLGLESGDVILTIGGRDVAEPADVRRILASYEDDEEVVLRVLRRQAERDVLGRLP